MSDNRSKIYYLLFFLGALLRLSLFWVNQPSNAFDDHFYPILLIIKHGEIPAKDACWECFQPPVFYYISAIIGKVLISMGMDTNHLPKIFQALPLLYGITTLLFIYLIIKQLNISEFAKIFSFATICFLPRHIYMSAMHSNDTMSYMGITICIYLTTKILKKDVSYLYLILLSLAVICSVFIKYTNIVILPAILLLYLMTLKYRTISLNTKTYISVLVLFVIPTSMLGYYAYDNFERYGKPLLINTEIFDINLSQPPGKGKINFIDFRPWQTIKTPILTNDNIGSFWTLIYSRMWFDVEPKFFSIVDGNKEWLKRYYAYLNGEVENPPDYKILPRTTRYLGSSLIFLGLLPLLLGCFGAIQVAFGKWAFWRKDSEIYCAYLFMLLIICIGNAGGIILHTVSNPYYSSMKAAFFLNSMACYAVLLGLGMDFFTETRTARVVIGALLVLTYLLVTIHILQIVGGYFYYSA